MMLQEIGMLLKNEITIEKREKMKKHDYMNWIDENRKKNIATKLREFYTPDPVLYVDKNNKEVN